MKTLPDTLVLPARMLIGRGKAALLLPECAAFGTRGVLVHGASLRRGGRLAALGTPKGKMALLHWEHAGGEPTLENVERLREAARKFRATWIAGVGGGSVLDLAKAAAGLLHARRPVVHYHDGAPVERPGVPFAAVPTTAGTGAEVTVNSVLTNALTRVKQSIRDDRFMARLVILDADLLAGAPRTVIAYSGMDALTQAIESYASRNATWLSDQFALRAIGLIAPALPCVYANASAPEAEDLLVGSSLAGLGLALARLGLVHGLAHPLGGRYGQPHGLVCAVALPLVIQINRAKWGVKYDTMSRAAGGDLREVVEDLLRCFRIQSPFRGLLLRDRKAVIAETLAAGSTASNAKLVTAADVDFVLCELCGRDSDAGDGGNKREKRASAP